MDDLGRIWRRATTCELAWVDHEDRPRAVTAVPLVDAGVPCVALTYDHAALRPGLAAASAVAFSVTDSRSLPAGSEAVAAVGRVTVTDDVTGDLFGDDLLDQELRKYPPARTLVDSLLLRRENWWYLPRILLRLDRVEEVRRLTPRRDADRDALLVRDDGGGLRLDVVSAADWTVPVLSLRSDTTLRGDGGPVLAHGHDHSVDRERWEGWDVLGRLEGDRLTVRERHGHPVLDPAPLTLLQRWRLARALERGCRRGIAAAERDGPVGRRG